MKTHPLRKYRESQILSLYYSNEISFYQFMELSISKELLLDKRVALFYYAQGTR